MDAYLESGGKGTMGEVSKVWFSPLSQKWWVHIYVCYSVLYIYINSSISARIKLKCTSEKWILSRAVPLKCSGRECCSQPFTDLTFDLLKPHYEQGLAHWAGDTSACTSEMDSSSPTWSMYELNRYLFFLHSHHITQWQAKPGILCWNQYYLLIQCSCLSAHGSACC